LKLWYTPSDSNLDEFIAMLASAGEAAPDTPNAEDRPHQVPVYNSANILARVDDDAFRFSIMEEWAATLQHGAGIVVFKGAFADHALVDRTTGVFNEIMEKERLDGTAKGDHFGTNDRIWNALQKLCVADPNTFADYYSNVMLALVCEAWLGPNYQVTSQTNLVHPGGQGQTAHRDYHMGFQSAEEAAYYPAVAHHFSAHLTLQGAVAHVDMPLESGPTKYLPFSQLYGPGYLAVNEPGFRDYFEEFHVQLPLAKGDAVFFNPATFHGAGSNTTTDVARLANLLQVSSAMGRATEAVDRTLLCETLYPILLSRWQRKEMTEQQVVACVAASAEGYAFPTNLDSDPPIGGLAPKTQADVMLEALQKGLKQGTFLEELAALAERKRP